MNQILNRFSSWSFSDLSSMSGCSSSLVWPSLCWPLSIVEFFRILAVFSCVMDLTRVAKESRGGCGPRWSCCSSSVFSFSPSCLCSICRGSWTEMRVVALWPGRRDNKYLSEQAGLALELTENRKYRNSGLQNIHTQVFL